MSWLLGVFIGQCTQMLQDKLKLDLTWETVSKSYDPLQLYSLIEKTILKQLEDQYPFAVVAEQAVAFLTGKQGNLMNLQWSTILQLAMK